MNKILLMGRLGSNPEIRYTGSGTANCNFTLATHERWRDKEGKEQERTEWHKIVVWSKLAELCAKHLTKGSECFLEGKIQTRSWEDKDGAKRHTTEIVASEVKFIGARKPEADPQPTQHETDILATEVPF